VSHPSVEKFDALLKQSIQRITNSDLFDLQLIQANFFIEAVAGPAVRSRSPRCYCPVDSGRNV